MNWQREVCVIVVFCLFTSCIRVHWHK